MALFPPLQQAMSCTTRYNSSNMMRTGAEQGGSAVGIIFERVARIQYRTLLGSRQGAVCVAAGCVWVDRANSTYCT
jgi:hypothetical protein